MRMVELGGSGLRSSALGFGCSAVMGRVGRKESLRALSGAVDAGITFFDTARSYGYGESEALLGEFLRGRRGSVVLSTKFGILPAETNFLKESLKPVARKVLQLLPGARRAIQGQIGAQFTANQFSVAVLRSSVETSLRKLQTDSIDLLWMHQAPVSVLQQEDLLAALEEMVRQGTIRRYGVSSGSDVAEAALAAGVRAVQFPCNVFEMGMQQRLAACGSDVVAVANHPFGGVRRVEQCRGLLAALARAESTPEGLRERLRENSSGLLADVVLNAIVRDTAIQVVVPSMMQPQHLRANVAAMESSRFSAEEIRWLRQALVDVAPMSQKRDMGHPG